jgi:ribonuclease Z
LGGTSMSILRVTFLGTSAAQPTIHRNLSGISVKADTDSLLFDCGEGSQRQMIRFGTGFAVDAVFFTHFHADHYLGIIGFLRTLGMTGRDKPMLLYGPPPAKRLLHQAIHLGVDGLSFPVEITELKDGARVERGNYSVRAVQVDHRVNALAYVLEENARAGKFNLDKARELGIAAGPDFGKLQRKLVLSGDTRPCEALVAGAKEADVLIHESTFSDDEQERALETRHSTAREAGRVAREAGAKRLVLTHLSSRHDVDPSPLLKQAREEFAGSTEVATDGLTFEIGLLD